jgi:uncharacterized integral membrane protein
LLRKIVTAIILVPLALIIVAFAVANRQSVTVSFDPFSTNDPAATVSVPLFGLVIVVLITGVIVGGVAAWLGQGGGRRALRRLERDAAHLRGKLAAYEAQANEPSIIPTAGEPPARLKLRPPGR